MSSILSPYLRYVSLKAQRSQSLQEITVPSVQVHSYFGLKKIPGFDKVFLATQRTIQRKYQLRRPRPDTIPTAAEEHASHLVSNKKFLSNIALLCILPSTATEIAKRINYHIDEVKPILTALRNKKILTEESERYTLSIVADNPPSGSMNFQRSVVEAALKGWVETKAKREDIDSVPYATIVENVRPRGKKSVKNILVLDLLRAPNAYPEEEQVQPGQLSFLFEEIYPSPLEEACLFATLSMPQTNETLRDNTCSAHVSNILGSMWGKAKAYGFIDNELKTTPYGERVIATLAGTPLAPFRHIRSLLEYCSRPEPFKLHRGYRSEFMKVIYSGVLYEVLAEGCGLRKATQIMRKRSRIEFFLSAVRTSDFYLPHKLANELEVDETSAKNVFAQAFRYGACGISTTSHPHLYHPTRKAKGVG